MAKFIKLTTITLFLLFILFNNTSHAVIYNQDNRVSIPNILKAVENFEKNVNSSDAAKKRKEILLQLSIYGSKRTPEMNEEGLGFIFHMIKLTIGEDKFNEGLEKVKGLKDTPSLTYLQVLSCFKGIDADSFYEANFTKMPLMKLDIKDMEYISEQGGYYISFTLNRTYGDKLVNVPYMLEYSNRKEYGKLQSSVNREETFKVPVKYGAVKLIIDPNYHLLRQLNSDEKVPVIADMFFQEKVIYISENKETPVKNVFNNIEFTQSYDDLKFSMLDNASVIIDGYNNKIAKFYTDKKITNQANSEYFIFKNPQNKDKYILMLNNAKEENLRLLEKYGMNQELLFKGGALVKAILPESHMGIYVLEHSADVIITTKSSYDFNNLMNDAKPYKTIFVGENHEEYSHHLNQLAVIEYMYNTRKNIAIGMEMVQYNYLHVINDYIKGRITEKEMLHGTDYFKNWGYDYTLYAPIFKYARDNNIDIIPLNLPKSINSKIFNGQIDNLTKEEVEHLPKAMNILNSDYEKSIYKIFQDHNLDNKKFSNFYLSQNIWDEVMAKRISDYRQVNPETTIIVLTGNGHAGKDSGIPYRYKRLTGEESYVIMQGINVDNNKADAFIYPTEVKSHGTPTIGITITDDKNMVKVKSVLKDSPADKVGLKSGDIILKCGYHDIIDIGCLKFALYEKGYNSTLECSIKRGKNTLKKSFKLIEYNNDDELNESIKAHIEKMKNRK